MAHRIKPFFANSDQLLLGAHLLAALESGRMTMHPLDYRDIGASARATLERLDTPILLRLRDEGPNSLQTLAENVLQSRGEIRWAPDASALDAAGYVWSMLCRRLTRIDQPAP